MDSLQLPQGMRVVADGPAYCIPEDQLSEVSRARTGKRMKFEGSSSIKDNSPSAYAKTCTREFGRDFTVITVGRDTPNDVPLESYDPSMAQSLRYPGLNDCNDNVTDERELSNVIGLPFNSRRILGHYHPGYTGWKSTFKYSPLDVPNLLADQQSTENHVFLQIMTCGSRSNYEPLFATLTLYGSSGSVLTRLSETFNFDATPDVVRAKYKSVYTDNRKLTDEILSCVFSVPSELIFIKSQTLYFVFQVEKVVSGDTDTMLSCYTRGYPPKMSALHEASERLGKFRSPIAFGLFKLNEDAEVVCKRNGSVTIKTYPIKVPLGDGALLQWITNFDNGALLPEQTDIEITFAIGNVGREDQILTRIPPEHIKIGTTRLLPSQTFSNEEDRLSGSFLSVPVKEEGVVESLRLLPIPPHPSLATTEDVIKRMLSFFDNTLFVYPITCERFQHRNLSFRFQLVRFDSSINPNDASSLMGAEYTVLRNIYDTKHSPVFCSEAYTKVHYHSASPAMNDEIKMRIPLYLTHEVAIKVTAYHVHVQPKAHGRNVLEIGNAFLNLMTAEGALIEDKDYLILLEPTAECLEDIRKNKSGLLTRDSIVQFPVVKIRTRALSSMYSSDPKIHTFLSTQLSYPLVPNQRQNADMIPSETTLDAVTFSLHLASPSESTRHFFVIFRQLVRTMCSGNRVRNDAYVNPANNPFGRCSAFISMLQLFGKISPVDSIEMDEQPEDSDERNTGEDFLRNYIDFMFDIDDLATNGASVDGGDRLPAFADIEVICLFVALQIEEVIIEELYRVTLESIKTSSVHAFKTCFRWWGLEKGLGFDCEKSWLDIPYKMDSKHPVYASSFDRLHSALKIPTTTETEGLVELMPIQRLYEKLDSFNQRLARIANDPSSQQWQPWLYEVLIHQWSAVLVTLQSSSPFMPAFKSSEACDVPYPSEDFEPRFEQFGRNTGKEIRSLLLGHGPLVLKLISKSLAFRISREKRHSPVVLDDKAFESLKYLVQLLSAEVLICLTIGAWRSRKLNCALAEFLRGLFSAVAPIQVYDLIQSYFLREPTRKEELDLRMEFLDELSQYDHFVAINFPSPMWSISTASDPLGKSLPSIRGVPTPSPGWLCHLIIREVKAVSTYEKRTKTLAFGMLRDLLVRLSYDSRYQSTKDVHRIAVMFVPLFDYVLSESDSLTEYSVDAVYRKELSVIFLYLLQSLPEKVLRSLIRQHSSVNSHNSVQRNVSTAMARVSEYSVLRFLKVLHVIIDTCDLPFDFNTAPDLLGPSAYKVLVPTEVAVFHGSVPNTTPSLALLDQRMHLRSGVKSIQRQRKGPNNHDERKWKAYVNGMQLEDKRMMRLFSACDMSMCILAAKGMGHESTMVLLRALNFALEDVPRALLDKRKAEYRDPFMDFMTLSVGVLLHCLCRNSSEIAITFTIQSIAQLIRNFGGKMFLAAAGDSLQDWISCILEYCGNNSHLIRSEAYLLLILLCQSVFYYNGSITILADTALSTFSDIIYDAHSFKGTHQSKFVANLLGSFEAIKVTCSELFIKSSSPPYPPELARGAALAIKSLIDKLTKIAEAMDFVIRLLPLQAERQRKWSDVPAANEAEIRQSVTTMSSAEMSVAGTSDENYTGGIAASPSSMLKKAFTKDFMDGSTMSSTSITVRRDNTKGGVTDSTSVTSTFKRELTRTNSALVTSKSSADTSAFGIPNTVRREFTRTNSLLGSPMLMRKNSDLNVVPNLNRKQSNDSFEGPESSDLVSAISDFCVDTEYVFDLFLEVTGFFNHLTLPRTCISWYDHLMRLHEVSKNTSEIAEIHWRVFLIYDKVKSFWQTIWAPRDRIVWLRCRGLAPSATRNFLGLLQRTMQYPGRFWASETEFQEKMESHMSLSMNMFLELGLVNLAERAHRKLIEILLSSSKVTRSVTQYQHFASKVEKTTDITVALGMGLYYRVWYIGSEIPATLRSKEFIYRNDKSMHLSDFGSMLNKQLIRLVPEFPITIVLDTAKIPADDFKGAAVVIMSVKPMKMDNLEGNIVALNQAKVFQHSVPFTKDGAVHARSIEKQWKRVTLFEVGEPFPCALYRQIIVSKQERNLEPLEVAIDDISIRNEAMRAELNRDKRDGADTQNLMRIIQGGVMPQVNGGVLEVARVFLANENEQSTEIVFSPVQKALQSRINEFLELAKQLLEKAFKILLQDNKPSMSRTSVGDANDEDAAARIMAMKKKQQEHENNVIWMREMTKGYDTLVKSMVVFLADSTGFVPLELRGPSTMITIKE